jgi:hypothetical protein
MTDSLNTKNRSAQYNGPVDSADYNSRVEENYKDLVYLYNRSNIIDARLHRAFERVLKDQVFISNSIKDLSDRVAALEAEENIVSIYSFDQLANEDFVGTSFAIPSSELLSLDPAYNILTLPIIRNSSYSKIKFGSPNSGQFIPDFFRSRIDVSFPGVDVPGAVVDSTPIYNSILDDPEKYWKRTIVANSPDQSGAQSMVYIKVPTELVGTPKVNSIKFNPYPLNSVNIISIEYTTRQSPSLDDSDVWYPLNNNGLYDGNADAIGKVPPGGWALLGSDAIRNASLCAFHFAERDITAFRIKMSQKSYFKEVDKFIYTYGLSDLDVRYDRFLSRGRAIFKFDAPDGEIISSIVNVTPKIYNVPLSLMSTAFNYRVIYDDAGTYTLTNPGASNRVWIEVTLNQLADKTPPVLSDLIIQYN